MRVSWRSLTSRKLEPAQTKQCWYVVMIVYLVVLNWEHYEAIWSRPAVKDGRELGGQRLSGLGSPPDLKKRESHSREDDIQRFRT